MERESLVNRVEKELARAGLQVNVGLTASGVRLSGTVGSVSERALAEEVAGYVAEGKPVENNLDIAGEHPSPSTEQYEYLDEPFGRERPEVVETEAEDNGSAPYFPPTDPVSERGEVVGGFEGTSMDSLEVELSASSQTSGDEALAEAILRELREDAATTDLVIDVTVDRGIVHLRGRVADLEDAENAEEVAGRLPGVLEVVEEFELSGG